MGLREVGFLTHDSADAVGKLHNQGARGATEHDPADGDWDEVELLPDGCWKSTKIASTVLGATWIILGKVCLST